MKVRRVLELMMLRSSPQDGGSLGFCAILVDHFTSRKPVQRSVVEVDDLRCNHVWSHICETPDSMMPPTLVVS